MDNKLDIQQITEKIKDAFKSYKCIIKDNADYANGIYIHILDKNDNSIILERLVPFSELDTELSVSVFIEQKKEIIRGKGYSIS